MMVTRTMLFMMLLGQVPPEEQPNVPLYALHNIEVKDGDTIRADIVLPFGVALLGQDIRAADYDAPEISRHRQTVQITDEELKQGMIAKRFISDFILVNKVYISPYKKTRDVYGRILGLLYYEDQGKVKSLGNLMKERGFIRGVIAEGNSK